MMGGAAIAVIIIASLVSYRLLRRGVPWRLVMLIMALVVFIAGILSLIISGQLQTTQVLLLAGGTVSFYLGMLFSWLIVGDVFREYGARW